VTDPDSLFEQLAADRERKRPPVSKWHPERTGSSAMRIASDGRWYYQGSEIRRPEMVKLFSTILRREGAQHFLVTPAEKLSIDVDDAPFLAVDMEATGNGPTARIAFRTNVDDFVEADIDHPIRLKGAGSLARPYVVVRDGLEALISRPVYYRLAELTGSGTEGRSGVWSNGEFFALELS
jgi:uncharacterized protein